MKTIQKNHWVPTKLFRWTSQEQKQDEVKQERDKQGWDTRADRNQQLIKFPLFPWKQNTFGIYLSLNLRDCSLALWNMWFVVTHREFLQISSWMVRGDYRTAPFPSLPRDTWEAGWNKIQMSKYRKLIKKPPPRHPTTTTKWHNQE